MDSRLYVCAPGRRMTIPWPRCSGRPHSCGVVVVVVVVPHRCTIVRIIVEAIVLAGGGGRLDSGA